MKGCPALYLFSPRYLAYDFGPDHPLRPERGRALQDLLAAMRLLDGRHVCVREPAPATEEELLLAHAPAYVDTVKALSGGLRDPARAEAAGLGEGDTPAFPGMHEAAATIAGGTLAAARAVMAGEVAHAFNPGGGLHHAHRHRASGFCIYNDLVVAIAAVVQEYEAKVLYLDFDVHHGDGVQAAFYDDPRVLTVSFHETGRYLFPGTGAVLELGTGPGLGYSVNVPLTAFTQDDSWLAAVEALVPALAERFRPDLIVSQFGCDGHAWDGQAHFRLTTAAYARAARLVHELAHEHCRGRWVATGGGGYDPVRVVPRVWTLLWAEMRGAALPETLPEPWLARWAPLAAGPMPHTFIDPPEIVPPIPRRPQIERENAAVVDRVRTLALSPRLRQAYRPAGPWTPSTLPWLPRGRSRTLHLPPGIVHLRDRCPASVVRRLRVAPDLGTGGHDGDREIELLARIAARPESNLVLAHTPGGDIVGVVTLAPAEGRWGAIDGLYELAIEVAPDWRDAGLGEALLRFALEPPYTERLIIIVLGISWHWDLPPGAASPWEYRDRLIQLLGRAGFRVVYTDHPDIMAGEANVLLARIGKDVPHETYDEFHGRLLHGAVSARWDPGDR